MAEISASKYGQLRGISKQAISKAIKTGRLDKCLKRKADGTTYKDPKTGGYLLDPAIADLEFGNNTTPNPHQAAQPTTGTGWQPATGEEPPPPADGKAKPSATRYADAPTNKKEKPSTRSPNGGSLFMDARTDREQSLAEIARLDLEERQGKLVAVDAISHELEKIVTETKTRILAVPGKARSMIPHLTNDDVVVIDKLLRAALTELADASPVPNITA